MVAKLAVIILAWAVMAASVLSLRQQRFETVKRMSLVKRELDRKERALWDRRASVASCVGSPLPSAPAVGVGLACWRPPPCSPDCLAAGALRR